MSIRKTDMRNNGLMAAALITALLVGVSPALGQDADEAAREHEEMKAAYFQAHQTAKRSGTSKTQLQAYLSGQLRGAKSLQNTKAARNASLQNEVADHWAQAFTLSGVEEADLEAMAAAGFDFTKGSLPATEGKDLARHNVQINALGHDLVMIGTVESVEMTDKPEDGYLTTFRVRVDERLKGTPPSSVVTIRQNTGKLESGKQVVHHHSGEIMDVLEDPERVEGRTYLWFVSEGTYHFRKTMHRAHKREQSVEEVLRTTEKRDWYELGYAQAMKDGTLLNLSQTQKTASQPSRVPSSTDQMLSYIREVDRILRRTR